VLKFGCPESLKSTDGKIKVSESIIKIRKKGKYLFMYSEKICFKSA
jgi:hypothetical protein